MLIAISPILLPAQSLNSDLIYCGNTPAASSGSGSIVDPFGNSYEAYELYVPTDITESLHIVTF